LYGRIKNGLLLALCTKIAYNETLDKQ